jgi:hypothetical protein
VAIRPEFRWWILTVVVLGVLLMISALALDRPNVVWSDAEPYCPHCRANVAFYSSRCQTCREQYDWTVAPEDEHAISRWSLSSLEANHVHDRIQALGPEEAAERVARKLSLDPEAAQAYLETVARGLCGYCGGTGRDLGSEAETVPPCPVCFGRRECIACGGDRRERIGDEGAHRALLEYQVGLVSVQMARSIPEDVRVEEIRRLTESFVRRHHGTVEATELLFWPRWPQRDRAVSVARRRLDLVIAALEEE